MLNDIISLNSEFPLFFQLIAFGFGAIVGSFLNVCIYRIPAEKSVITPGSHCSCGQAIPWYQNIPIFTWLILRGKSACCKKPFSIRYPAIELLTAVLFALSWRFFPPSTALIGMLFISILICATFIDLDHMIIPDRFSIGGALIGVMLSFAVPSLHGYESDLFIFDSMHSGFESIIGLLIGSSIVLWIGLLAEIVLKKEAMGFGDVKFLGAIGAFIGWQGAIFSIFGGAIIGTLWFALFLLVKGIFGKKKTPSADGTSSESNQLLGHHTPFGPMLAAGGLLYFLVLHPWVDAYFNEIVSLF
jgi:leader peptidase (prepilin peptidase)/N-methyltransferase